MQPKIDPYAVTIGGRRADPYRIAVAYGITHPALQQALKKLLRMGRKHKTATVDALEVISSVKRFLDMEAEDAEDRRRDVRSRSRNR